MPQPLRDLPPDLQRGSKVLREHPQLGINIAVICAAWASVEGQLGTIAAFILGANSSVATRMYLSLAGAASRNAVLRSAAAHLLPTPLQKELGELLVEYGTRQKERNRIVHAEWAYSPAFVDALLHIDPSEETAMFADVATALFGAPITGKIRLPATAHAPTITSYRQKDFSAIETRINTLSERAGSLWVKLSDFRHKEWHEYARRESEPALYPIAPSSP